VNSVIKNCMSDRTNRQCVETLPWTGNPRLIRKKLIGMISSILKHIEDFGGFKVARHLNKQQVMAMNEIVDLGCPCTHAFALAGFYVRDRVIENPQVGAFSSEMIYNVGEIAIWRTGGHPIVFQTKRLRRGWPLERRNRNAELRRSQRGARRDWLLASGFWLLASGFWLLASGFWLLASGFWLLASGFWLLRDMLGRLGRGEFVEICTLTPFPAH
jgi:hypothetical protein